MDFITCYDSYEIIKGMPSHRYKDKIAALKENLRTKHGITFFYFQRRHKGKVLLHIVTDLKWQMRYVSKYFHADSFQKPESIKNKDYYVWEAELISPFEKMMHEERTEIFGIPSGISYIRKNGIFEDTFSYSTTAAPDPITHIIKIKDQLLIWEQFFLKEIEFIFKEQAITQQLFERKQRDERIIQLNDVASKQRHVLQLLAQDYETGEIAKTIHLAEKSVQKIIEKSKENLGCKTRAGLIAKAMRFKII